MLLTQMSELLTDDLLEVEQRIEFIKQTCSTTAKKLSTTLVSLRSELLTDDLLEVEQRIEFIKQTCSTTAKKLSTTLVSLRKSPEYQLGVTLNDMLNANVNKELDDDLLR
ncbi:uncharacterized protein LOC113468354 [Diaphorina citri]|uniref:Uncharacterized protein LOC113468354 n=1 Tax=Diaphorina citri TaxID=121845 RepID=A0A3Q0IXM2_DIACI|nr:uncharacterized protein LOC113468354 [Diaphorina citri]